MRIGIGFDSHRFVAGRPLILGGVEIGHDRGLEGWSDGDPAAHALTDAILGASALGDIGQMFPSDNPKWKDAKSLDLLRKASLKAAELGYSLVSADITIIAEEPKLSGHVDEMRERLAEAAVTGFSNLAVKAKTNDGMGFIGRREGIAVIAVVLLEEGRS
jgi:2-C-methyl-D-erythritol 2,4-cyclodiphosphate synthase